MRAYSYFRGRQDGRLIRNEDKGDRPVSGVKIFQLKYNRSYASKYVIKRKKRARERASEQSSSF